MSEVSREAVSIASIIEMMSKRLSKAAEELNLLALNTRRGAPIENATEAASIVTNVLSNMPLERLMHLAMEAGRAKREVDRVLIEARSSCQCEGPQKCQCSPYDELVFKVNGKIGFGSGALGESLSEPSRRVFACTFMGLKFEADDVSDAAEKLKSMLSPFQSMSVDFHQ